MFSLKNFLIVSIIVSVIFGLERMYPMICLVIIVWDMVRSVMVRPELIIVVVTICIKLMFITMHLMVLILVFSLPNIHVRFDLLNFFSRVIAFVRSIITMFAFLMLLILLLVLLFL